MKKLVAIFLVGMGILLSFPQWSGAQWVQTGGPEGGCITAFAVSRPNLFASTRQGGVFLSTDNGASWKAVNSGLPEHTVVRCLAVSGLNLFAGTGGGRDALIGAGEIKYINHGGGVFLSTNNGISWTAVNSGLPPAPILTGAEVGVWIECLTVSGSNLFAGTEEGKVWRLPLSDESFEKWYALGVGYEKKGRTDDAIAAYKQAVKVKPDFGEAWFSLGFWCGKAGRIDEAIGASKKSIELEADNADAWFSLGACYEKAGRKDDAAAAFDRARSLKPDLFKK